MADPQHAPAADPNVRLSSAKVIAEMTNDITEVWRDLLTTVVGISPEPAQREHVRSVMAENALGDLEAAQRQIRRC
jgi:hypothetical protein